jgi:hypothetical protein
MGVFSMKGKPIFVRLVLLAGAIVVVVTVLVCEHARFMNTRRAMRNQTTRDALASLQFKLIEYMIAHRSLPGPTLRDAMDALEKEGDKYYESRGVKFIDPGVDGWGHPIIYELRDPTHALVRSVGENGVDENGKGDDIEREVSFEFLQTGVEVIRGKQDMKTDMKKIP